LQDWIKSRENEDDHLASAANGSSAAIGMENAAIAKRPKLQYIPVPDNPPNSTCPICQEKFEMKWLDEAQEFVWMDTVKVGGRIYHASCHAEVKKDSGTPEPVLGKRKNEVSLIHSLLAPCSNLTS
jgi:pre-mRNA cleavage complex 2 protein Pcf11